MSVTEDAPHAPAAAPRSPLRLPGRARRASPWWWLVAGSALILAIVAAVMAVWWLTSRETRIVPVPRGRHAVGGRARPRIGPRPDRRRPGRRRRGAPRGGVRVQPPAARDPEGGGRCPEGPSRCPDTVLGTCAATYRVTVPDNVQVNVRTSSGRVAIRSLNASGRVTTGSGPDRDRRLLRLHDDRDLDVRRRAGRRGVLARPPRAAVEQRGRARGRAGRAATGSTPTATGGRPR